MAEAGASTPGGAAPTTGVAPAAPEAGTAPAPIGTPGTPAPDAVTALAPPAPPPPAPAPEWTQGYAEDEVGFVQAKGWSNHSDMLRSYRALESLQGVSENQLIKIPGNPDDQKAWGDVYNKLGRPAEASAYEFGDVVLPQSGVDLSPDFRAWAHNAGLTQRQAKGIFDSFQGRMTQLQTESQEQVALQTENDLASLRTLWGNAFDAKIQAGSRFAQRFGLDTEKLTQLEGVLGTRGLLEFTAMIGEAIGEHAGPPRDLVSEGQEGQFGITPAHAKAKISELKGDKDFQERLFQTGDKDAKEHWRLLHEAAYPGQVVSPIVSSTQRT